MGIACCFAVPPIESVLGLDFDLFPPEWPREQGGQGGLWASVLSNPAPPFSETLPLSVMGER